LGHTTRFILRGQRHGRQRSQVLFVRREPLAYYDNNVTGSVALLACMIEAGVKTLVFSSPATMYDEPVSMPIREDFALLA
jgi:UDP-glucose 4-epimerase